MKKIAFIVTIAAAHLALCKIIVVSVRRMIDSHAYDNPMMSLFTQALVASTKILYFPLLSLSLYSRQYFPGKWIYAVIVSNSLIWAVLIYFGVCLINKINRRPSLLDAPPPSR